MSCPSCGAQNEAGATHCTACGASLASGPELTIQPLPEAPRSETAGAPEGLLAGRFRVQGELGRGGMGTVVRAQDEVMHRSVALKRLLGVTDLARTRFLQEARAVAALDHPHICRIHDFLEIDSDPVIVMQLIEGVTLRDEVQRSGAFSIERTVAVGGLIGQALLYAHEQGVLHRDIKPANILLGAGDHPWLIDFGVGRLDQDPTDLTVPGTSLGTMDYASPEQRQDASTADVRSDIYSFGMTLYYCATARSPRVLREAQIPEPLRALIVHCTEEEPDARPASMAEVLSQLSALSPVADVAPALEPEAAPAPRRRRVGLLVAALALLAVAAVKLWPPAAEETSAGPDDTPGASATQVAKDKPTPPRDGSASADEPSEPAAAALADPTQDHLPERQAALLRLLSRDAGQRRAETLVSARFGPASAADLAGVLFEGAQDDQTHEAWLCLKLLSQMGDTASALLPDVLAWRASCPPELFGWATYAALTLGADPGPMIPEILDLARDPTVSALDRRVGLSSLHQLVDGELAPFVEDLRDLCADADPGVALTARGLLVQETGLDADQRPIVEALLESLQAAEDASRSLPFLVAIEMLTSFGHSTPDLVLDLAAVVSETQLSQSEFMGLFDVMSAMASADPEGVMAAVKHSLNTEGHKTSLLWANAVVRRGADGRGGAAGLLELERALPGLTDPFNGWPLLSGLMRTGVSQGQAAELGAGLAGSPLAATLAATALAMLDTPEPLLRPSLVAASKRRDAAAVQALQALLAWDPTAEDALATFWPTLDDLLASGTSEAQAQVAGLIYLLGDLSTEDAQRLRGTLSRAAFDGPEVQLALLPPLAELGVDGAAPLLDHLTDPDDSGDLSRQILRTLLLVEELPPDDVSRIINEERLDFDRATTRSQRNLLSATIWALDHASWSLAPTVLDVLLSYFRGAGSFDWGGFQDMPLNHVDRCEQLTPSAIDILEVMIEKGEPMDRAWAFQTLGNKGQLAGEFTDLLVAEIQAQSSVSSVAMVALAKIAPADDRVAPLLLQGLESERLDYRVLKEMGRLTAVPIELEEALQRWRDDWNPVTGFGLRIMALEALWGIHQDVSLVLPSALAALRSVDPSTADEDLAILVQLVGRCGPPAAEAEARLRELAIDPNPQLAWDACVALARLDVDIGPLVSRVDSALARADLATLTSRLEALVELADELSPEQASELLAPVTRACQLVLMVRPFAQWEPDDSSRSWDVTGACHAARTARLALLAAQRSER